MKGRRGPRGWALTFLRNVEDSIVRTTNTNSWRGTILLMDLLISVASTVSSNGLG